MTKINTKSGEAIWSLGLILLLFFVVINFKKKIFFFNKANNGLDFLDSRTEFWRQQQPIYARKSKTLNPPK